MNIQIELVGPNIAGLAEDFHVNPDSCDNPEFYETYLKWISYSDLSAGENTTHLLTDKDSGDIIGFIALRATSMISDEATMKGTPALEISVLAVNQKYEHMGYGKNLVDLAIMYATDLHEHWIGVHDIVLMADHKAVDFYKRLKFRVLEDYMNIPKLNWNKTCVPMVLRLGFGMGPSFACYDSDDEDDE